jgi:hypothetical protein
MKFILHLPMLMLSASVLSAPNEALVSYSAGAFTFEEQSSAAVTDLDDLRVHAPTGKPIALKFNRSRGVADVVDLTTRGNLRLGGQKILWPDGHIDSTKKGLWALSEGVSVQASPTSITVHSQWSKCRSIAPTGFRFEQLTAGQLPRSAAASDKYAYAILEAQHLDGHPQILLPFRINLTTCQVAVGTKFESPGFDYRLQVRGERALLASSGESALLLSNDGLAWRREGFPTTTHVLLAADITPSGVQVAVSRADRDFATSFYSKAESDGADWQETSDIQSKPMTWIGGAREAAISAASFR